VIDPVFLDTPLYRCEALEPGLGCTVSIKLETANPVRSFKARGTEVIASLLASHGSRAVVCASAGNLGQALAWSGRGRGLDVTVVASRFAPAAKLDRIRALDARLELVDGDFDLARERAAAVARHDGIRLVEDSLDIETCGWQPQVSRMARGRRRVQPDAAECRWRCVRSGSWRISR
jgi:threonine dehydratase